MSVPDGPSIDVSMTIRPRMPIYAGNPGVAIELARSIERGDEVNVSRLEHFGFMPERVAAAGRAAVVRAGG